MPGIPSGRSGERRLSKHEQIRFIVQECDKQAEQWKILARKLGSLSEQVRKHAHWLYENAEMWESIASACNQNEYADLASKLDLSTETDVPRDIFLIGLSTLDTYDMTWEIVIGSSVGYAQKRLQEIYRIECEINEQIHQLATKAGIYMRGTIIEEAAYMHKGMARGSHSHTFVSMTVVANIALRFGPRDDHRFDIQKVIMILDASRIRELGAKIARYSIASEALHMGQSKSRQTKVQKESINRMFRFGLAAEAQVHLDNKWPPEASDALWGIATAGEPTARVRDIIDSMNILSIPIYGA